MYSKKIISFILIKVYHFQDDASIEYCGRFGHNIYDQKNGEAHLGISQNRFAISRNARQKTYHSHSLIEPAVT